MASSADEVPVPFCNARACRARLAGARALSPAPPPPLEAANKQEAQRVPRALFLSVLPTIRFTEAFFFERPAPSCRVERPLTLVGKPYQEDGVES